MSRQTQAIVAGVFLAATAAPAFGQGGQAATAEVELSATRLVPAETTAAAYNDKSWTPPRTSWGDPVLAGNWSTDDFRSVPMNRSAAHGTRESLTPEEFLARAREDETGRDFTIEVGTFLRHEYGIRTFGYTSLVIDPPSGRAPALTAAGQALAATRTRGTYGPGPFDDYDDFTLYERCITRGVLGSVLPVIYGNGVRIGQSPGSVSITYEMIHDTRVIPLVPKPKLDADIEQYMGSARGHFDGDTLVVETTNFTDATNLGTNGNGSPNSTKLKLTERFRRIDPAMIEYLVTVDDALAYEGPYTMRLMLTSRPGYELQEYSCHEGNEAVSGSLSGERVFERQVAESVRDGLPMPARATDHNQIRNGPAEGTRLFNINEGE